MRNYGMKVLNENVANKNFHAIKNKKIMLVTSI